MLGTQPPVVFFWLLLFIFLLHRSLFWTWLFTVFLLRKSLNLVFILHFFFVFLYSKTRHLKWWDCDQTRLKPVQKRPAYSFGRCFKLWLMQLQTKTLDYSHFDTIEPASAT